MALALALDLLGGVHGEGAGAGEPELVAGSPEQGEERETVARRPVAEAGPLGDRPGPPGQLPARQEDVERGDRRERRDHAGRAVAPLGPHLVRRPVRGIEHRRPLREVAVALCGCEHGRGGAGRELGAAVRRPAAVPTRARRRSRRTRAPDRGSGPTGRRAPAARRRPPTRPTGRRPRRATPAPRPPSPVRECIASAASIVPGEPHMSSRAGLDAFARTHASRRSSCQRAGARRCATSRIPASPIHSDGQAADVLEEVRAREVALVQPGRDRAPVAPQADVPQARELVERPDDPARAEVQGSDRLERALLLVARVGGPQRVRVERRLGVRRDGGDRGAGPRGVPRAIGEALVGGGIEQHPPVVARFGRWSRRRATSSTTACSTACTSRRSAGPACTPSTSRTSCSRPRRSTRCSTGDFDGDLTFAELAEHGDLGLGTLNGLDGEMLALDGRFLRADADGNLGEIAPDGADAVRRRDVVRAERRVRPGRPAGARRPRPRAQPARAARRAGLRGAHRRSLRPRARPLGAPASRRPIRR